MVAVLAIVASLLVGVAVVVCFGLLLKAVGEVMQLRKEKAEMCREVASVRGELESLRGLTTDWSASNRAEIARKNARIAELEASLAGMDKLCESNRKDWVDARNRCGVLEAELVAQQNSVVALSSQMAKQAQEEKALRGAFARQEAAMREALEESEATRKAAREIVADREKAMQSLREALEESEAESQRLRELITGMDEVTVAKLKEVVKAREEFKKDAIEARKLVASLNAEIKDREDALASAKRLVASLHQAIEDRDQSVLAMKDECQAYARLMTDLKGKLDFASSGMAQAGDAIGRTLEAYNRPLPGEADETA